MKKLASLFIVLSCTLATAQGIQQNNTQPSINVTGEGKIMVEPDRVDITIGVTNTGNDAATVKKENDAAIDKVIKFLKAQGLKKEDYQTQRVNLNRNYDYNKKKYNFMAAQTIAIHLKDLSKYETLMMGLTDEGVNTINGIDFKSSKQEQYESEARTKAVADARKKATDYTNALGQKLGKAITVNDNTQSYNPPVYRMSAMKMESDAPQETLAPGEITIIANVNISFALE